MSYLDRLARILLVRPGEYRQTGYFILVFLLLGAGLAIGRGSADALFFKRFGIEYLPLMFVFFGILLAILSTVYAAYADRIPSERFLVYLLLLVIVMLAAAWLMMYMRASDYAYPVYFLVYEVSSEILMMHALFYLSQNFETLQAKRLTPLIFAAAQLGKITGGIVLSLTSGLFGVQNMVFLWMILCGAGIYLVLRRHARVGVSPYYRSSRKGTKGLKYTTEQVKQGFKFAQRSDLLKAASFALFFLVISYYIVCYSVNRIYTDTFKTEESLSVFFGILTAITAGSALLIQLFVTGKLLQRFGVRKINLVFPTTGILSYFLLIASFSFPAALVASFNKDALMTAIRNPTRNLFFNALPDYMQGRGRALLLAMVLPMALVVTGGFLHVVRDITDTRVFLLAGMIASVIYLLFSIRMNNAYVRTILNTLRERVFLPEKQMENVLRDGGDELRAELVNGVNHEDPDIAVSHASLLVGGYPQEALPVILTRIKSADPVLSDQLLNIVRHLDLKEHSDVLWEYIADADTHFKATIYSLLFENQDARAERKVVSCLHSENPRFQAIGVYGVYQYACEELYAEAERALERLMQHTNPGYVLAGLDLLRRYPASVGHNLLTRALDHNDARIQKSGLEVVLVWPEKPDQEWFWRIQALCDSADPEIRVACARVLGRYSENQSRSRLFELLEDRHPRVRREAVLSLNKVLTNGSEVLMNWIMQNAGSPRAQQSVLDALDRNVVGIDLFARVAQSKVNDARRCRELLTMMETSAEEKTPARELMMAVLRERIRQYTDLILGIMSYLEDPNTLNVIRAGLQSGDSRQVANACEALSDLKNRSLASGLGKLYGVEQGKIDRSMPIFRNLNEGLDWVCQHLDAWIVKIAKSTISAG